MKPLILLIHTQNHVDLLPQTAQTILAAGFDRCWVVTSPAIAADAASASAKLDSEIAALKAAQDLAAAREDYEAASGHKLAREGKILDRDKAIADAWKSVPEEDRKNVYRAKLQPLFEAFQGKVAARMVVTQEHYAAAQWIQMLNALSGIWPKEFVHGEYVVAWPGAIPQGQKSDVGVQISLNHTKTAEGKVIYQWKDNAGNDRSPIFEDLATANSFFDVAASNVTKITEPAKPLSRRDELTALHHMSLRPIAKDLGIDVTGKGTVAIIEEILEAEKKSAGELANY